MPLQNSHVRFVPQSSTPAEAFDRATRIPRDVRQLGEALTAWTLSNITRDTASPYGDLPRRFGFDCERSNGLPVAHVPYHIALTAMVRLHVTGRHLVCAHRDGSTILDADRFELAWTPVAPSRASASLPLRGIPPATDFQWVLGWACLARTFALLSQYEKWVIDTVGVRYRYEGDRLRPKTAKRSAVDIPELPNALAGLAEWCGDSERAMLAWVIADARERGAEPLIPKL